MNQTYLKFKTRLLFNFLGACFFCFACKDEAEIEMRTCYLTSSSSVSEDNLFSKTATYDAEHRLLTESYSYSNNNSSFNYTFTYAYNAEGKISEMITSGDNPGKTMFFYDPNGNWIQSDHYNSSEQLEYKNIHEFNSSNQISKSSFFYPATTLLQYIVYEYPNPTTYNFSRIKSFKASGTLEATTEYEYDNMNPVSNDLLFHIPTHNVTKATSKDSAGEVLATATIEYKYNEYLYPIKSTTTFSGISYSISVADFGYDCL